MRLELPIAFEASRLEVWRTEGRASAWQKLAAFPLGSAP